MTLRRTAPPIWRALRVPARLTLAQLHDVLQVVFGWTNYWVGRRFDPERFDMPAVNKKLATLAKRFAPRFRRSS